ncbi:MAG: 50S ribosomal protein L32 [Minisyncoccales bacterium]
MGVPKKKRTKSRQGKTRMHIFLKNPSLIICSNCQKKILAHRVCPFCGYFKGEKVREIKIKEEKKKKE